MVFSMAFCIHDVVVSLAITPLTMDTVSSTKTVESKMTILTLADCLRNRLLEAILRVNPALDSGLSLFSMVNPKYCIGESAFIGDIFAASSMGLAPEMSERTKKVAKTSGASQKLRLSE